MMYQYSCEEHKYLAGLRREKEAFERLIKERAVRLVFSGLCPTSETVSLDNAFDPRRSSICAILYLQHHQDDLDTHCRRVSPDFYDTSASYRRHARVSIDTAFVATCC